MAMLEVIALATMELGYRFGDRNADGCRILEFADGLNLVICNTLFMNCLLYTSPSPRDRQKSRMPSSA